MRIPLFIAASLCAFSAQADSLSNAVVENLYAMKSVYRAEYAPAAWKKTYANYDLDKTFEEAVNAANANPNLTQLEAREILKNFIYAMKDYHTSISFVSTEAASLPLTIKGADDRFFIGYIDRSKLSESAFPFHVGDELVSFDGKPVLTAVMEVQNQITENVPATDRALAELSLTNRRAARGIKVPQGPVMLGIKARGSDKVTNIQLIWDYTPEQVSPRGDVTSLKSKFKAVKSHFSPMMDVDFALQIDADNPYGLGTRKTFTPDLGTKIWESENSNTFYAYIYMNKNKKLIGYLRLPSYHVDDYAKAVADFKAIVSRFESTTDAMVIDQVNNPGGSVFYLYTLASMLSDQPLHTPQHRMSITQAEVLMARKAINVLQSVKTDEDARKVITTLAPDLDGYPVSYELSQFMLSFYRMIVSEWDAGRKLTRPYWIEGVDHINPADVHYTRPILLLTNHLDFSGGDFFPTILKDNNRVTILGSRTAGAGGYVNNVQIPNNIGIDAFRVTESIAERINGNPIENLGVTPDIIYEMTAEDYQSNFRPYTTKVQEAVDTLIK
ncbi:MAG TPA: protease-like activity factor CPAF [Gammaproteobacteria bacterium]|jgi:hypothetical protein|nr:protease-like activity factor CPAF [Gammaproteobacteria bacterium]